MSAGKGGSTNVTTPELSPEQRQQIQAQNELFTSAIAPHIKGAVQGSTNLYQTNAPGVLNAAQNLAGTASQAGQTLGETGESAARTGITGLESLFSPEYATQQLNAAMAPAQAQYMQNMANLQAGFGGAGQLGSARSVLAQQQLAGATQAAQQQAAAQVLNNIAQQQYAAGGQLASLGQAGLTGAQAAGANQINAAMAPQQLYNQYAGVIFGTPAASYTPDFRGTQGSTVNKTGFDLTYPGISPNAAAK